MGSAHKPSTKVDEAVRLFESEEWDELAALPMNGGVSEADAARLDERVSQGESPGPWRRWAASRGRGSAFTEIAGVLLNLWRNDAVLDVLRRAQAEGVTTELLWGEVLVRTGDWKQALPHLERSVAARESQWELAAYRLAEYAVVELDRIASGSRVSVTTVEPDDFDRPRWLHQVYAPDLVPYLSALPTPDDRFPPIFSIDDEQPLPSVGQLARAAQAGLRIEVSTREQEFDLRAVAAAIPELVNLTIDEGARVTGLGALKEAVSLRDLDVRIRGTEPVDLSVLPALESAQVMGQHLLSVCRNPSLRVLSLRLTRASLRPVIEAPVERLHLTARHAGTLLEGVRHPEKVRVLSLWKAHDVDLSVLERFVNLEDLSLNWCTGVTGTASLAGRTFRKVEVYRCRNIDDLMALRALQVRPGGGAPDELMIGPFVFYEDEEEETVGLSTSEIGWDGIAPAFAEKILSFSGHQMERLVVAIAKDRGLWTRLIVRDSESENMHLYFRDKEAAVAVAKAAWAVFQDADQLAAFTSPRARS